MGGNSVTEGLMNASGMTLAQAEGFKAQPQTGASAEAQVVSDRSERFISEIRGSLDYYRAQNDSVQIERLVLTGGGSLLPGLTDRLAATLRLPVDREIFTARDPFQQLVVQAAARPALPVRAPP